MSQTTVKNRCPHRVWYRLYESDDVNFTGKDIAPGEQQTVEGEFKSVKGFKWERGEDEVWEPTFKSLLEPQDAWNYHVDLTSLFGCRPASSIKVFMACLAGPADPMTRNDIILIDKLHKEIGVPRENIWMFLERQCTPNAIYESLKVAAEICNDENDILFVYLGGHGSRKQSEVYQESGNKFEYNLGTWGGSTPSSLVLKAIQTVKCPVFMVVDSCYSGQMIDDAKSYFLHAPLAHELYVLTSTQNDKSAQTGW